MTVQDSSLPSAGAGAPGESPPSATVPRKSSRTPASRVVSTVERRLAEKLHAWGMDKGSPPLCAISGGGDSMALWTALSELYRQGKTDWGSPPPSVHVHHHLRGADADADAAHVAIFATDRGLQLDIVHLDPTQFAKHPQGRVAAAREARRAALYDAMVRRKAPLVLLAHTQDDQAETVLYNLCRGTGLRGLAGMPEFSPPWGRPLLGLSREILRQYLTAKGIRWREDATNADPTRARARIRHQVLPLIRNLLNPRVDAALAATAAVVATTWGDHRERTLGAGTLFRPNGKEQEHTGLATPENTSTKSTPGQTPPSPLQGLIQRGLREAHGGWPWPGTAPILDLPRPPTEKLARWNHDSAPMEWLATLGGAGVRPSRDGWRRLGNLLQATSPWGWVPLGGTWAAVAWDRRLLIVHHAEAEQIHAGLPQPHLVVVRACESIPWGPWGLTVEIRHEGKPIPMNIEAEFSAPLVIRCVQNGENFSQRPNGFPSDPKRLWQNVRMPPPWRSLWPLVFNAAGALLAVPGLFDDGSANLGCGISVEVRRPVQRPI